MGVFYPVSDCGECPNMKSDRHYTADSFENVMKWQCKAVENRVISHQDTFDKPPPIPQWCPLRKKKAKKKAKKKQ